METVIFKQMLANWFKNDPCFWAAACPAAVCDAEQSRTIPMEGPGVTLLAKLFAAGIGRNQWPELTESFLCSTSTVRCLWSKLTPGKLTLSKPVAVGPCCSEAKLSHSCLIAESSHGP